MQSFRKGRSLSISYNYVCLLLAGFMLVSPPAYAETSAPISDLARDFFQKISPFYKDSFERTANEEKPSPSPKKVEAEVELPPGTEILLVAKLGKQNLKLVSDIYGYVGEEDLFFSFNDFVVALELPISINLEKKQAQGWFRREDNVFSLDLNNNIVSIGDRQLDVPEADISLEDFELFVSKSALQTWFDLEFNESLGRQTLKIATAQPLPLQERYKRRLRGKRVVTSIPESSAPRLPDDYRFIEFPALDARNTAILTRQSSDAETEISNTYTVGATGDLAYMSSQIYVTGEDQEGIQDVRVKLSRASDEPNLLGALKATRFEIGDISTVRGPQLGTSRLEAGISVTNARSTRSFNEQITQIEGDIPPDWDIELYDQNDRLVETVTAGNDSRYQFNNIRLFPGDNDFRLVFYGPQGEIREEQVEIPFAPGNRYAANGIYEVSISNNDRKLVEIDSQDTGLEGSPHIAGRYQQALSDTMTATIGARYREEFSGNIGSGQAQQISDSLRLSGSLSKRFGYAVVTTNVGTEALSGGIGADLDISYAKDNIRVFGGLEYDGENYSESSTSESPETLNALFNVQGNVDAFAGTDLQEYNINYGTRVNYEFSALNDTLLATQSLGWALDGLRFDNSILYNKTFGTASEEAAISGNSNVNYNLFQRASARSGLSYKLQPESSLSSIFSEFRYTPFNNLSLQANVNRRVLEKRTDYEVIANYFTDYFTLSPRVLFDTEGRIRALLTTRMNTLREPKTNTFTVSRLGLGQSGSVSALVFIDKDGDGRYSEGDELAPEVKVEALQSRKSGLTNEDGVALIKAIPAVPNDIVIDENSFLDAFWVDASKPVSVLARPGHITQVEYPIVIGGEIDGTVSISDSNGITQPAANILLNLVALDGKVVSSQRTARDGYYLFSRVLPGSYLVMPDAKELDMRGLGVAEPLYIKIGYEGTLAIGEDILLENDNPVRLTYVNDFSEYASANPMADLEYLKDHSFILNFGQFRSSLRKALTWYRISHVHKDILGDAFALIPASEGDGYLKDGHIVHDLRVTRATPLKLETAKQICRDFQAREITCEIEILPRALSHEKEARQTQPDFQVKPSPEAHAG